MDTKIVIRAMLAKRYDAPRHDCGESIDGWKPPTAALVPATAKP
jgi:hypothetical protein